MNIDQTKNYTKGRQLKFLYIHELNMKFINIFSLVFVFIVNAFIKIKEI